MAAQEAEDEYAPIPAGGGTQESGFLGGFPSGFTPQPARLSWPGQSPWAQQLPPPAPVSLDDLRQQNSGGYMTGDEWRPINAGPDAVEVLQQSLLAAGLIDPDDEITPGRYDNVTRNAYRDLLIQANGMGVSDRDALDRLLAGPLPSGGKGKKLPPRSVSNPSDLREVFRKVSKAVMGRGTIDDALLDKMVSSYQQAELAPQIAGETAGSGETITAAPDPTVFAEQQLQAADPVGYDSRKAVEKLQMVDALFRGESVAG